GGDVVFDAADPAAAEVDEVVAGGLLDDPHRSVPLLDDLGYRRWGEAREGGLFGGARPSAVVEARRVEPEGEVARVEVLPRRCVVAGADAARGGEGEVARNRLPARIGADDLAAAVGVLHHELRLQRLTRGRVREDAERVFTAGHELRAHVHAVI